MTPKTVRVNSKNCWVWKGVKKKGYAFWKIKSSSYRLSRIVYRLFYGHFSPTLLVLHKCDNPPCINPEHLFLGTHLDNSNDKLAKNRGYFPGRKPIRTKAYWKEYQRAYAKRRWAERKLHEARKRI